MTSCGAAPAATWSTLDTLNQCAWSTMIKPVSVTVEAEAEAVGVKVRLTLFLSDGSLWP